LCAPSFEIRRHRVRHDHRHRRGLLAGAAGAADRPYGLQGLDGLWLERLGATVRGVALPPDTQPNLFEAARIADGLDSVIADIRDPDALAAAMLDFAPSVVVHMAPSRWCGDRTMSRARPSPPT
jgi:CDP-glucose 4,6-dehydratase